MTVNDNHNIAMTETTGSSSSNVPENHGFDNADSLLSHSEPVPLDTSTAGKENRDSLVVANVKEGQSSSVKMTGTERKTNPFLEDFSDGENTKFMISDDKPAKKQVFVDTTEHSEFEKEVGTEFGGGVDSKANKGFADERHQHVEHELEMTVGEIPKYIEQCKAAEVDKNEVLRELDDAQRLVEDLQQKVEKAETQDVQAKQDSELAELRMKELEQGIDNNASVATKAQLEVAKERHTTTVEDLVSVKQELEDMKKDYASLMIEKDAATRKAEDSISASKEIERTVQDLTLELLTTKELLVSAQSTLSGAEEHGGNPALASEQDTLNRKAELEKTEAELWNLDDLKVKCDAASATLASLKAELDSRLDREAQSLEEQKLEGITADMQINAPAMVAITSIELDDVRERIEKSRHEVGSLKTAVSSLKSELETEKESLSTMAQTEGLASTSLSSLEVELNQMNTELELIHLREQKARERMSELPKLIKQAAEGADQAKALANSAQEELKKAKEDAEQAKAGASTMDTGLPATPRTPQATNGSFKHQNSGLKALLEDEQTSLVSEEPASKTVISATEQDNSAKDSESASLVQLEEKKTELKSASEKAEKPQVGKEKRRTKGGVKSMGDFDNADADSETKSINSEKGLDGKRSGTSFKFRLPRLSTFTGSTSSSSEPKTNKKSFFPRVIMFLVRKKAQSLK